MNWHFYILFTFAHIVHSYGYFIEPDILKPDMYNLYEKMSVLTPSEKKWHLSSLEYSYRKLKDENRNFYSDFLLKKIFILDFFKKNNVESNNSIESNVESSII